ncbi:MAG: TetR/AcrR family transcriptional regulator [Ilumatobacteraceae bacterium]|nr:TetR/AcrR family transcriptional regulator [Acidimicrobiales bacterium]
MTSPGGVAAADERVRQPRGEARREAILAEAVTLFAAKGFRGTTITELADRVGMTHPGLLYYFGTKQRLLLDVVRERERREASALLSTVGDGPEELGRGLRAIARFVADDAVRTRLYVVLGAENLDPGDPLHDFFVDRYARVRDLVASAVRRSGAIVDADQLAREVVATLMGLEIQWLMDPSAFDYLTAVDTYADAVERRLDANDRTSEEH